MLDNEINVWQADQESGVGTENGEHGKSASFRHLLDIEH
jgi:hypothetical protein